MDAAAIVARIEAIARENGVNGVDLGRLLGKAKSPLTDWRNCQSMPTLKQIYLICEYFAVSADYILFGVAGTNDSITQIYAQLDERGQQAVLGVALSELTRKENMPRLADHPTLKREPKSPARSDPSETTQREHESLARSDPGEAAPMKQKRAPKAGAPEKKKAE